MALDTWKTRTGCTQVFCVEGDLKAKLQEMSDKVGMFDVLNPQSLLFEDFTSKRQQYDMLVGDISMLTSQHLEARHLPVDLVLEEVDRNTASLLLAEDRQEKPIFATLQESRRDVKDMQVLPYSLYMVGISKQARLKLQESESSARELLSWLYAHQASADTMQAIEETLRFQKEQTTRQMVCAGAFVQYLQAHPLVSKVEYPGIPTYKDYAHATKIFRKGFGTRLNVRFSDSKITKVFADMFKRKLQEFGLASVNASSQNECLKIEFLESWIQFDVKTDQVFTIIEVFESACREFNSRAKIE